MKRVMMISSDCHGGIPTKAYKPYLEKRYHADLEDIDKWMREAHLDGTAYFEQPGLMPDHLVAERDEVANRASFMDSAGRLKDLESNGVVSEVIYPTAAPSVQPPWSDFLSAGTFRTRTPRARELQGAGEKAYNRWLAEFCGDVPRDRRLGLALLPLHDIKAARQEVQWAFDSGLRGIVLPFFNYDVPEYCNAYWEPLWATCEELRMTVNFHGGYGSPEMGDYRYLWMLEMQMWARRTMSQLMFSGVYDRYPRLQCTVTEARASWIPAAMAQFDQFVHDATGPTSVNNVLVKEGGAGLPERLPSEYWRDNWFAGSSITNLEEMRSRHEIGIATMMYGIDYPHPEGSWGDVNRWLSAVFGDAGVEPEEVALILGENAARLYDLDVAMLRPVVERVGPTMAEVMADRQSIGVDELFETARATGRALGPASYQRDGIDLSKVRS